MKESEIKWTILLPSLMEVHLILCKNFFHLLTPLHHFTDYILVLRLIKNPLWVTIVLVPVAVIGVMIFFLIYAKPYESLEEFSMDIGIYTPKEQEEEELLTIGAESAELKTGGLTKRNV